MVILATRIIEYTLSGSRVNPHWGEFHRCGTKGNQPVVSLHQPECSMTTDVPVPRPDDTMRLNELIARYPTVSKREALGLLRIAADVTKIFPPIDSELATLTGFLCSIGNEPIAEGAAPDEKLPDLRREARCVLAQCVLPKLLEWRGITDDMCDSTRICVQFYAVPKHTDCGLQNIRAFLQRCVAARKHMHDRICMESDLVAALVNADCYEIIREMRMVSAIPLLYNLLLPESSGNHAMVYAPETWLLDPTVPDSDDADLELLQADLTRISLVCVGTLQHHSDPRSIKHQQAMTLLFLVGLIGWDAIQWFEQAWLPSLNRRQAQHEAWTADETAKELSITPEALEQWRNDRCVVAIPSRGKDGGWLYPKWQVVQGGVMMGLPEVLKALPQSNDPWRDWEWLTSNHVELKNVQPLSYIRHGRSDEVLRWIEWQQRSDAVQDTE